MSTRRNEVAAQSTVTGTVTLRQSLTRKGWTYFQGTKVRMQNATITARFSHGSVCSTWK